MWLYDRLTRVLPGWAARVTLALWYALLIVAVLFFCLEPQADFNYGNV